MYKHLIAAGLVLALVIPSVTAKVTRHARAAVPDVAQQVSPVPTQWRPRLIVVVDGDTYTLTRGEGFKTEDECKAFLTTDEFRGETLRLALAAHQADPDATFEGEPECVARSGPSDPA